MKHRTKVAPNLARMLVAVALLASAACQEKTPSLEAAKASDQVTKPLVLTVPDRGWRLTIERILELPSEVWILANVERSPGMAAQAITTVAATLPVTLPAKPQRVFIAGKTWGWKNDEPYEFVPSLDAVKQRATSARVLFPER